MLFIRQLTMALWLVVVFFPLSIFHQSFSQETFCEKSCPINEVFSSNVSQCQNTCYRKEFNKTTTCAINPGCVCRQGFIRNQDSYQCIPLMSCLDKRRPKQCPDSEFYSDCDAGSECQKTCRRDVATNCNCVGGCVCRTGFVRNEVNFQCIPEELCQGKYLFKSLKHLLYPLNAVFRSKFALKVTFFLHHPTRVC